MQKVVIIGQGYTGRLSLVRSVAVLNCEITLIVLLPKYQFAKPKRNKPLDAYSRYVSKTLFSENYNEQMLVDTLLNNCTDKEQKVFIFPDNDFSAAAIDNHRDKLKPYFYCPHVQDRQGAVAEWMSKVRQKKLASQIGLNTVHSNIISVRNQMFEIPDDIFYPCFVKPLMSIVGGKIGLKKCDNPKQLREHIIRFMAEHPRQLYDVDFLVEDFKKIDREFATLGFSDGCDVIIPGLLELLKIGHGSHFGVAIQGKVFPVKGYEELVEKFKLFVKQTGFVGIFDIDFFESQSIIYFCEMNLRFGGSGYAFTKLGVNLPVMMIKSFLGESINTMNKIVNEEAFYFNERMAMDDWYGGHMTTKELLHLRQNSDVKFVEDEEDPVPQKKYNTLFRINRFKKIVKGIIGKKVLAILYVIYF